MIKKRLISLSLDSYELSERYKDHFHPSKSADTAAIYIAKLYQRLERFW
jgi:hypothetical protein